MITREIDPKELTYSEKNKIGCGSYGTVYKGIWKGVTVAIKKFHDFDGNTLSGNFKDEFKKELSIMYWLRHDHVVEFRVCTHKHTNTQITEGTRIILCVFCRGPLFSLVQTGQL